MVPFSILLYHQVGEQPLENCNLDCFCSTVEFRLQMQYLKDSAARVLSLDAALALASDANENAPPIVVLTFDDGDVGFTRTVLPILQAMQFPATVFAVAGMLGGRSEWVRRSGNNVALMSPKQLCDVHAARMEIGSHSLSHRRLSVLTPEEQWRELADSKALLEDLIGEAVRTFSFPHGDFNAPVCAAAEAVGYVQSVTCTAGRVRPTDNRYQLPRNLRNLFRRLEVLCSKGWNWPRGQ